MLGSTKLLKMHLLPIVILLAFMVGSAVQLQCDPLTQYEMDDLCCKMCGPGTRMSSPGSPCTEQPQCTECGENEYQDKYTKEEKCIRQKYCDPNKFFKPAVNKDKKTENICMCKDGYHCSDETCIACVQHTECQPGEGAKIIGNNSHNTICEICEDGTFSTNVSWKSVCQKWTPCGDGYYIKQRGTAQSDNICEKSSRTHIILISVSLIMIAIAVSLIVYWRCRENVKDKVKVKHCFHHHSLMEEEQTVTPIRIVIPHQSFPTDPMLPEPESTQEEGHEPEENLDEESQETGNFTDNGNYVMQENGKSHNISLEESQTQTFTDSL